jgi:uncharacterized protein YbcV (DUF1398 family)
MNAQQTAIAHRCLAEAYDNTMSFPDSVKALMEAGFEAYMVDYRRNTRTYYLPDGETLVVDNPPHDDAVAPAFDKNGVAAAVKWAQANAPDYNYVGFNKRVIGHGCAGYFVSFCGRRVVYFGRTGEQHVEWFPGAAQ